MKRFFQARDALLRDEFGTQAGDILAGLSRTRVQAVLTRLLADDPSIPPPLEPMLPALARISPLAGLLMVDSRNDPRVQATDLLAGMARRLPEIVDDGPLQPFVSPTSLRDPQPRRTAGGTVRGAV